MEKKSRILYLLQYLYDSSDELNPVSSAQIMDYLESKDIKIHRTTINADIELMRDSGIDVITIKSSPNKYYIGQRTFELQELKLLVDAVASSKFITEKKSNELLSKISKLTSSSLANELNREIYIERRIKHSNEKIYYVMDRIQEAIRNKKKIEFKYLEWTPEKTLTMKNRGYWYEFSPYTMLWCDDHYYVVGHSRKHKKIVAFRVDRIEKPELVEGDAVPPPADFDPSRYFNQVFEMFDGEKQTVELKCANELMRVIVDRFGIDVETSSLGSTHFKVTVDVSVSPRFFGWLFGFAGKISILGPEDVKQQYKSAVSQALDSL